MFSNEIQKNTLSGLSSENRNCLNNNIIDSSTSVLHLMQQTSLKIIEEPQEKFRFRYKSETEKASHGSLTGVNHKKNNKTCPTVKLENYKDGQNIYIKASLYTNEQNPVKHVHVLRGINCEDGEAKVALDKKMCAKFTDISIQHSTKDDMFKILTARERRKNNSELTLKEEEDIRRQIKKMDMNYVILGFQAFIKGQKEPLCPMVFSQPICHLSDLKIARISEVSGSCVGNEDVFLLCDKINKKDNIQVRFFESDEPGCWESFGTFNPTADIHKQVAIVFKTPPYTGSSQAKEVEVYMELYRPKDNARSQRITFTYYSEDTDSESISCNRKRKRQVDEQEMIAISSVPCQHQPLKMNKIDNFYKNSDFINHKNYNPPMKTNFLQGNMFSDHNSMTFGNVDQSDLINHKNYNPPMETNFLQGNMFSDHISVTYGNVDQSLNQNTKNVHELFRQDLDIPQEMLDPDYELSDFSEDELYSLNERINDQVGVDVVRNQSLMPMIFETADFQTLDVWALHDVPIQETDLKNVKFDLTMQGKIFKGTKYLDIILSLVYNFTICLIRRSWKYILLFYYYVQHFFAGSRDSNINNLKEMESRDKHELKCNNARTIQPIHDLMSTYDDNGNSLLHILTSNQEDSSYFIKRLLNLTPGNMNIVNQTNHHLETPIHLAIIHKKASILRLLLKKIGKNRINIYSGDTCLHMAAENNSIECLKVIIRHRRQLAIDSLGLTNYEGLTPLHTAVKRNHVIVSKMLVKLGANVNQPETKSGKTALHLAVNCNSYELVRFLLNQPQVNIHLKDYFGNTAFHLSYCNGYNKISEILRSAAVDGKDIIKDDPQKFDMDSILAEDFANLFSDGKIRRRIALDCSADIESKEIMENRNDDHIKAGSKKWIDVECEKKLCSLLDPPNEGWSEFALFVFDEKDLSHVKLISKNPTKQLLNLFQKNGGNVDSLKNILQSSESQCLKEAFKIVEKSY